MSEVTQRIAGTYISDSDHHRPPIVAWLEFHCRYGALKNTVEKFAAAQQEQCEPRKVIVEAVEPDGIACRLPAVAFDHEDTHPFRADVAFKLNPLTGETKRVIHH